MNDVFFGHTWTREIPVSMLDNKYRDILSDVSCSYCGVPKTHEDASKSCPREYRYRYMKILNGDYIKLEEA